jgi:tRNA threonylcarbamoyladenosine biosynthesis protein TsaB
MTILAIDTSTQWCSVALFISPEKYFFRHELVGNSASQVVLAWIEQLMSQANVSLTEIDRIAVCQGPGSFTGIRLGIGVAQGLAFSQNMPLIPIPSVAGMIAAQKLLHPEKVSQNKPLFGLLDARMGECYVGQYLMAHGKLSAIGEIELIPISEIKVNPDAQYFLDESLCLSLNLPKESLILQATPHALGIASCANEVNIQSGFRARDCQPLYIRDQVALTTEQRAVK